MKSELVFLMSGIFFGLAAGVSPGPLLALVISETMKHHLRGGVRVALAPAVTDAPIVLATLFLLTRLPGTEMVLGIISLAGAVFIGYLAYESITVHSVELDIGGGNPQSLMKGVVTNFLNPHPYIFWLSVGAPTLLKALAVNVLSGILFVLGFYLFIVGSKIVLALVVARFRSFLTSSFYLYTLRAFGIVFIVFAVLFIKDGLRLLGIL